MEEKNNIEEEKSKEYIKILNKEKVLEFKLNQKSGFDESEIIVKNICEKNIISKIYINNQKYFKFNHNIFLLPKNSEKKIKVVMDNKDYIISNKDIFLIISNIIDTEEKIDENNLDDFFKKNSCKEKGQKVFLYGYKKYEKKIKNNPDNEQLIKKIKELEKEVFEYDKSLENIKDKDIKNKSFLSSYINYLILFVILVFAVNLCISKK